MRKLLTNLAVFLIFFGCGFKPIYKMTSDDATLGGYSVEVTNQVKREIIEVVNKVKNMNMIKSGNGLSVSMILKK